MGMLNRDASPFAYLQPIVLALAAQCGLRVSPALASNTAATMRVYVVGDRSVAFELRGTEIRELLPPAEEDAAVRALMGILHMDFAAADFNRDARDGHWVFLELNTSPRFARFDQVCGGKIGKAILQAVRDSRATLTGSEAPVSLPGT